MKKHQNIRHYDADDYGILSKVSKQTNAYLGDTSGRSISLRTAQGFKKASNLNVSDNTAVHIVHVKMLLLLILLFVKDRRAKAAALLLFVTLLISYHIGK